MVKKILVVDDEPHITGPIKDVLEEQGYRVDILDNGKKALDLYHLCVDKDPYDLILLDIVIPRMSGLEVLNTIRKEEEAKGVSPERRVPIIMLSGLKETWMNDAFQDGCNDYIVKPCEMNFLLMKVREKIGEGEKKNTKDKTRRRR